MKKATVFFLIIGCIYFLIHLNIMFWPQNVFYAATPNFDRVEHFTSGFVLGGIVFSEIKHKQPGLVAFFSVLALGIIFEIVEFFTPYGGFPDGYFDLMHNQMGAILGIFVAKLGRWKGARLKELGQK